MENMSREELEKALEKAKQDAQAMLDQMTPEERAQAMRKAEQRIEEDSAAMRKLIDDAKAVAAGAAPVETAKPKFSANCGAPALGGKFCTNCGSPL